MNHLYTIVAAVYARGMCEWCVSFMSISISISMVRNRWPDFSREAIGFLHWTERWIFFRKRFSNALLLTTNISIHSSYHTLTHYPESTMSLLLDKIKSRISHNGHPCANIFLTSLQEILTAAEYINSNSPYSSWIYSWIYQPAHILYMPFLVQT